MKTETRPAGTRLAHIELLKGLPQAEIAALEQRVGWQRHKAGEQILTKDSESRDAFLVAEGRVQIVNYSLTGREIAYATVPTGSYFGELSAIDGEPRSATVIAHTDCLLATVPPDVFRDCVQRHPSIALAVIQKLARIVRVCDDRIMDLSVLGAHQRVYGELLRLAKPDPITAGSWLIFPLPTQHDIAGIASTTRETVARVVSQLTHAGIVQRKGKTLYIRDRAKLQRLAERSTVGTTDAL
jgi:CRP-like cAMP-binding protein